MSDSLYDIPVTRIDGQEQTLAEYAGKVLLIVNTASECGFTPQYAGLEELYRQFGPRGLVVLGFPCNQFGAQEPGDEAEIERFCRQDYGVSFPLFAKIEVNGDGTHPLYRYLKSEALGVMGSESIKWNFTKFLVDRQGQVQGRYAPITTPQDLAKEIEPLL